MAGRVGEHRLEALAGGALALAAVLRRIACRTQAQDQLVAGLLELGQADEAPGVGAGKALRVLGGRGLGMGRKAPLEPRDLIAEGPPRRGFVATVDGRHARGLGLGHLRVAARIEDASQVARVNAGVAGGGRGGRGQLLHPGGAGAGSDESSLPLARGDETLRLEAAVDGPGGVGVDAHPGGELAHARQAVTRPQSAADDQGTQPPGEIDAHRQVVVAVKLQFIRLDHWTSTLAQQCAARLPFSLSA